MCKEIDPWKGYCAWTVSKKSQFVDDKNKLNGKTWWEHRPYLISMPPESYKEIKATMAKICAKYQNDCKAQDVDGLIKRMDSVIDR